MWYYLGTDIAPVWFLSYLDSRLGGLMRLRNPGILEPVGELEVAPARGHRRLIARQWLPFGAPGAGPIWGERVVDGTGVVGRYCMLYSGLGNWLTHPSQSNDVNCNEQ